MTKFILTSNRKSTWQMDREININERNRRITERNLNDPRAELRPKPSRESLTHKDMEETFPLMYEYLAEMLYAESESYIISIQEDEVEF